MNVKVEEVKSAINALSNPSETHRANEWLVQFEKSVEAWAIADTLMNESRGSTHRFLGAKFLYSKIQRDFLQLDSASIPSLIQTLFLHTIRLAQETPLEMNTSRYLCLSIAALAVQMNQDGVVRHILQSLNPILSTSPRVILELLIVLPEECYNRQVDVSQDLRDQFAQQLSQSVPEVFGFLTSLCCSAPSGGGGISNEVLCQALKCLERWIDYTFIPGNALVEHQIFQLALNSLGNKDLFDSAVDVIIATIGKFRTSDVSILSATLPRVLALRPMWAQSLRQLTHDSDPEDLGVCRSLCRLFTESAEACVDLILSGAEPGLNELVVQLVDCTRFPYDHNISRIPLKFFYELSMSVKETVRDIQNDTSTHGNRSNADVAASAFVNRFVPYFSSLFDAALGRVVLSEAVLSGRETVEEEVKDLRSEWKETIVDCCDIVGSIPCLQRACAVLENELKKSSTGVGGTVQWGVVEACLFAVLAIAQYLPRDEDTMIPQLMALLVGGGLPSNIPGLQAAIVALIGAFSNWVSCNGSYLPALMTLLCSSLQSPATCSPAAYAMMQVFKSCSGIHNVPIQEVHTLIMQLRVAHMLPLEADLHLLEGICAVISRLPKGTQIEALKHIIEPVGVSLSHTIASTAAGAAASGAGGAATGSPSATVVAADVDRLTAVMRYIVIDGGDVAGIFASLQPLLAQVLELFQNKSEYVCEKVCRCYKHSIRSCRAAFAPTLKQMTSHLAEQFQKNCIAAFLYAGAICVTDFSREGGGVYVSTLYEMLWSMSNTFFQRMSSLQQFEQKPDVVEEYFYLMAKALQNCPVPLLQSPQGAGALVQAGITGLQLKHKEAQKGILLFFERLIQLPSSVHLAADSLSALREEARTLVKQSGQALLSMVFASLAGQAPALALDENNGCSSDVMWGLHLQAPREMKDWIVIAIAGLSPGAQNIAAKTDLVLNLDAASSKFEFVRVLDQFEWRSKRN